MNRKLYSLTSLVIVAVLFVAINIVSNIGLKHARLDLTQNRLFTLSGGSKSVLAGLQEPITLRFFFSEKLANQVPQIKTYATRVRELLEEYANRAHGKIKLEIIDPEPFSDAEDRATQAGIQGVPLDPNQGEQFYFGLAGTNSTDRQEVIPFFQQDKEQFLEYDLTRLIYNLTDPKKPVLGILSDLPLEFGPGGMMAAMRGQSQPYAILGQLRQSFDVKMLKPDLTKIDKDVTVLMLAHVKALKPQARYAIDQYVLRGGHALVFVDPQAETEASQPGPMGMPDPTVSHASSLPSLFKAWGIAMQEGKFVADGKLAIRVQGGEGARQAAVDYVAWLAVPASNHNDKDVVTAKLDVINMASAGVLRKIDGAGTEVTPLLTSSDAAELMDVDKIKFRPDPAKLLAALKPTGERYVLAARITGKVKTAFPDGPPPEEKAADKDKPADKDKADDKAKAEAKPAAPEPQLKESVKPINVIVVADSDMLDDRFWVRSQDFFGQKVAVPIAANADFVVNAVDNLAGSNELISLRSRGRSNRPFEVVDNLRHQAGQQFLAQEQALQTKLETAQKRIAELQSKTKGAKVSTLLSAEEQSAIDGFRQDVVRTRKQLRDVQHSLNRGIERLGAELKFINIGLMPILVALAAMGIAGLRYQRRKSRAGRRD